MSRMSDVNLRDETVATSTVGNHPSTTCETNKANAAMAKYSSRVRTRKRNCKVCSWAMRFLDERWRRFQGDTELFPTYWSSATYYPNPASNMQAKVSQPIVWLPNNIFVFIFWKSVQCGRGGLKVKREEVSAWVRERYREEAFLSCKKSVIFGKTKRIRW